MAGIGDGSDVPTRPAPVPTSSPTCSATRRALNAWLRRYEQISRGVIVVLRDGTATVKVQALPQDGESEAEAARTRQWREVGLRRRRS